MWRLEKKDEIKLKVYVDKNLKEMFESNLKFLKERTNSKDIEFVDGKTGKKAIEFDIKEKNLAIEFWLGLYFCIFVIFKGYNVKTFKY